MKLYYSPGACSLSTHIALKEGGLEAEYVKVDLASKTLEGGGDFRRINPNGYVPVLEFEDGQTLMEGPAIVQYIADLVPDKQLAPPPGSLERYQTVAWLNFIATELHKGFGVLFNPKAPGVCKALFREMLGVRLQYVSGQLGDKPYLMGGQFSVADAYLYTVLRWAAHVNLDLSPWPNLPAYVSRVQERPAVLEALAEEGLLPA